MDVVIIIMPVLCPKIWTQNSRFLVNGPHDPLGIPVLPGLTYFSHADPHPSSLQQLHTVAAY